MSDTGPKIILIAEDEKPMAKALELKLGREGFQTLVASDGEEALSLLVKAKADLMLLDLIMPKIDGFRVLERMKAEHITTPVIVLTNLSQAEDEKRAKDLGAKDFFVKADTPIADIVKHVKQLVV